jgi:hypothetical protein
VTYSPPLRGTIYARAKTRQTPSRPLAELLGHVEVVASGPPDSPLPVTGHCSCCGPGSTVDGPAGHPLCDQCRERRALRPAKTGEDAEPAAG